LKITYISLFDKTIAGLRHQQAPAFSFQGHPEASPGPSEFLMLFNPFMEQVYRAKKYRN
jgi:carbamoyl-phosphate synthase small subunit